MNGSKAIAAARIAKAMEHIEAAQQQINLAAASVCSVAGLPTEWRKLCSHYKSLKATWHRFDAKLGSHQSFDLDPLAKAQLEAFQNSEPISEGGSHEENN